MLPAASLKFLEKFLNASGPSGYEFEQAKIYRDYLKKYADTVETDVLGNTIGRINPKAKFTVMLVGHYDEIGFQVTNILEYGLLSVRACGGPDPFTLPGTEVDVLTKSGRIRGVFGRKPIHLQTEADRKNAQEIKDLWIDIGVNTKEEAQKLVEIGDPVAFRPNCRMLGKDRIMSKGLDDKIGAFVIAEAFRIVASKGTKIGVACVGSVQEEVGGRGAIVSAFNINPNVGICVDVTFGMDHPGADPKLCGNILLGAGAVVSRNADNNPPLNDRIRAIAAKKNIPLQIEVGRRSTGGTDTAPMQMQRGGCATALFSIPNRYMHTPTEICDMRDVEAAANLIAETILSFKGNETFIPGID